MSANANDSLEAADVVGIVDGAALAAAEDGSDEAALGEVVQGKDAEGAESADGDADGDGTLDAVGVDCCCIITFNNINSKHIQGVIKNKM